MRKEIMEKCTGVRGNEQSWEPDKLQVREEMRWVERTVL